MMKDYQGTEDKAVQELIAWKQGNRPSFPMKEVKDHLNLFDGGEAQKEHKKIAANKIATGCLSKLPISDVQDIDKRLATIINPPKRQSRDFGMSM